MLSTASDGWGYFFFFDLFSHSGLRAFFTNDFANCTTNYASPQLTPTIRCCSQHLMVGVFFFWPCSPILDLGHFSQVILPIVLQIMPQPKNSPNHQVLFTASDGCSFFFDLFSHSGLRAFFTSDFANCTTNYAPAQVLSKITPTIRILPIAVKYQHSWWLVVNFFWPVLPFWT